MIVASDTDFLRIFNDRRRCFADLLALSREQLRFIEDDNYPRLLSILGGKQRIIGRLEALTRDRPGLLADWQLQRAVLPAAERSACEAALAETESILAELLQHEQIGADHLAQRRDQTRLQLQHVTAGALAQRAYQDNLSPSSHRQLNIDQ